MAVSNTNIADLERQMDKLRSTMQSKSAEISRASQHIIEENQRKLGELNEKILKDIENRDRIVQEEYLGLLDGFVSETQVGLEKEYATLQAQYDELNSQLKAAVAEEQHKTEEIFIKQKKFEDAYNSRQEFAKSQALTILEQVRMMLRKLCTAPVEWFLVGHIELYKNHLREMEKWINATLYESAIGVGENMLLSMNLDSIETEDRFRRWFHYYTVLREVISAEKKLIFESALTIGSQLKYFSRIASNDIKDGMMSIILADDWSLGMYSKLCSRYAAVAREIERFYIDGVFMTDPDELRGFMISEPKQSMHFQEMTLYSNAMMAIQRIDDTKKQIGVMFDRINAFEERCCLAVSIKKALKGINCEQSDDEIYSLPSETMYLTFSDSMRIYSFEVFLIPVMRRSNGRTENYVRCNIPEKMSKADKEELIHTLAETLVTKQIGVSYDTLSRDRTKEERIKLAVSDMQLSVNGRLN